MLTDSAGVLKGDESVRVMGVGVAIQRETQRARQLEFLSVTANPIDAEIVGTKGVEGRFLDQLLRPSVLMVSLLFLQTTSWKPWKLRKLPRWPSLALRPKEISPAKLPQMTWVPALR